MGMFALRLGAWLLPSLLGRIAFEVELVGGLLVFAGYIIFDSQVGHPVTPRWAAGYGRRSTGGRRLAAP